MPADWPDRTALGLPASGALYVCPMMLFKLHPAFDRCLAGILEGDRDGHVVLFEDRHSPQLGAVLRRRFSATLGANASRVRFLSFLPHAEFMAVLRHATVTLDTHPFGGATTLLNVISVGTPFVTRPTELTSGRTGAAFCKAIGVEELVAEHDEDYVRKALAVATDATLRARLSADIAVRSAVLFDNTQGARELAAFLERVCVGQNLATA
jgi:predicted O-linked N-acetylglucosamine transferase (SPINDLY family)